MSKKWFRNPENGESINYDCGCVYTVIYMDEPKSPSGYQPFTMEVSCFCFEHDPTLTKNAKEHEEEYVEANY